MQPDPNKAQADNEAMLQEVVQNTEMGKNTLEEIMGLTHDQALKDEIMRQRNAYRQLNQQAHTALDAIGCEARGQMDWSPCHSLVEISANSEIV